jgi:hypothetical protein
MIKIKWGIVPGIAAFALSFLTSLVLAQTPLLIALLRAAIFAAVFFGLGIAIRALIANFIPDLLFSGREDGNSAGGIFSGESGSRVNITVEDTPEAALPEQNRGLEQIEVGNFNDLVAGSIKSEVQSEVRVVDQNFENSYTEDKAEEETPMFDKVKFDDIGDFSMDFGAFVSDGTGGDVTGGDVLGGSDTDSDMDSFSLFPGTGDSGTSMDTPGPTHTPSGNKPMKLEGDFDPKEIAAGIRTVLKKEKG